MEKLLAAILADDRAKVKQYLEREAGLATALIDKPKLYQSGIFHWHYLGDTALHLAAAGYRVEIVKLLLRFGADPNAATNHRCSRPLHYAADGYVNGPAFDMKRQVQTIRSLVAAGAEINAQDKNGATALHRAVRTRSAAAVRCLLKVGADSLLRNKPGATPFHLAVQDTGRGGSDSDEARAGQRQIIKEFLALGVSPALKDSRGKSVLDWARSAWVREMLSPSGSAS